VRAKEPKPIDYVVEHLSRSNALLSASESKVELRPEVTTSGDCILSLRFDTLEQLPIKLLEGAVVEHVQEEHVSLDLKQAELDSPTVVDRTISVRMIGPAKAETASVFMLPELTAEQSKSLTPEVLENLEHLRKEYFNGQKHSTSEDRYKVLIPTSDGEEAKRISRALNEQIRLCGGKPDPFAK
jgi:hypothetical protein